MNHPTRGSSALQSKTHYTYADYKTWPAGERWELIEGEAICMSPAPRRQHQKFVGQLYQQLANFLEGKPCEPYIAPLDVFLNPSATTDTDQIDTVVQPDVLVVCDPGKLVDEGIRGAPDFIAEMLSDSTAMKDLEHKKHLYEKFGVREYWIVGMDGTVFSWLHNGSIFASLEEFRPTEAAKSRILPGFMWKPRST